MTTAPDDDTTAEPPTSLELVVRATGDVIDVSTAAGIHAADRLLRRIESQVKDARADLRSAAEVFRRRGGVGTYSGDFGKIVIGLPYKIEYDADVLEEGLRAAGADDEVIGRVITTVVTTSKKVDGRAVKTLASSNDAYAEAAKAAERRVPQAVKVEAS